MSNDNGHERRVDDGTGDSYDLDDLLGAYALDAVDDNERARVEDYLRVNPRAAEEVRQHREVATMLAFTGMDAPEGVWDRIADEIDGAAPEPGPELAKVFAMGRPADESARPSTAEESDQRAARRGSTWLLGAAAALAFVVAGAVVITNIDREDGDPIGDAFAAADADDASRRAELAADGSDAVAVGVIDPGGRGYLDASGLPELGIDQTYQLWGVIADNGDVVSLGILGNDPDLSTFTVDSDVSALAVTIEQAPGVISDGNPDGAYVGTFG